MRVWLVLGVVWACLVLGVPLGKAPMVPTATGQTAYGLTAGQPAPAFTAQTPAGNTVALQDYHGQPVIINFWATWCAPCRREMAALQAVYEAHNTSGLVILAVSQDSADTVEAVQAYWTTLGLTFLALLDPEGVIARPYRAVFLPTTVFVHPSGTVAAIHLGPMTQPQIEHYLKAMLPQPG